MANEIKIKITSDADTKGLDETNKALAETAVVAGVTDKVIGDLGDNMTESDRKGEKLGRTMAGTKDQLVKLDAGIASSVAALKLLSHSLADTQDAAQRLDIQKAINKVKADLSSSQGAKKILIQDLIDMDPKKTVKTFGDGLETAAPELAPAGIALGAAIAPFAAAALAGGLTGGIGIATIGAGIALIAKDPIIATTAKSIGSNFKNQLYVAAQGAFETPVLNSLKALQGVTNQAAPKIGAAFEAVAPSVQHLTGNIVSLANNLIGSLTSAAGRSGPAIEAIGDLLEHTGTSLGNMIDTLSKDVPQGVMALQDLDSVIQDTIKYTGGLIDILAKTYGVLHEVNDGYEKLSGGLSVFSTINPAKPFIDLYNSVKDLTGGNSIDKASDSVGTFSAVTVDATGFVNHFAESMTNAEKAANGEQDALEALSAEMKAETDPVFGLLDAQDKLAASQKKYTEDVNKHGKTSKEAESDLRDLAKASIDLEGKVGDLGATFNGQMSPALRTTLKAAGLTNSEIDALGKQFVKAKGEGNQFAKNYKAKVQVSGTDAAGRQIQSITDDLRAFQGKWTATMITNYKTFGKPGSGGGLATGGIAGASANGSTAGNLTWVGENGPELADLPAGTRVWSNGDSKRMSGQGGSGGGSGMVIEVRPGSGANMELLNALISTLQFAVRTRGGGSSNQLLNQAGVA